MNVMAKNNTHLLSHSSVGQYSRQAGLGFLFKVLKGQSQPGFRSGGFGERICFKAHLGFERIQFLRAVELRPPFLCWLLAVGHCLHFEADWIPSHVTPPSSNQECGSSPSHAPNLTDLSSSPRNTMCLKDSVRLGQPKESVVFLSDSLT